MIFYTADLHLGSIKLANERKEHFSSVDEMNNHLIDNWNKTVLPDDTVYLVGDISDHALPFPASFLAQLNGHKHLIRGNHDMGYDAPEEFHKYFETVSDYLEIDDSGFHITLCHSPILYYQNGFMIHGHIHKPSGNIYEILYSLPKVLNAGVDINHFHPVTLKELIQNNAVFYNDEQREMKALQKKSTGKSGGWPARFVPLA